MAASRIHAGSPIRFSCLLLTALAFTAPAQAKDLCTLVMDARDGAILTREGPACDTRVTPASSFKLPLALMGFDSGFLKDAHTPLLDYKPGDPDWGGAPWREPTDPARWIKLSIVWYSQRVTHALGATQLADYAKRFNYGNADVSGTLGKVPGLDGAWINSSLRIAPAEQVAFLRRVVNRELGLSTHAYEMAEAVTRLDTPVDGWEMHGKTGTGSPGNDGHYDATNAYGWFVGWARKGERTLVFARLIQDERKAAPPAGLRARESLLQWWAGRF